MKNQRGITLIALIMTIVLMMTIGTISYNAIAGDNRNIFKC